MENKKEHRKLNFDQLMVLGAMKGGKLDQDPDSWPEDADFYRGLATLAIILHRVYRGEFGTNEDEAAFQWWETCKDGEGKERALEIYNSFLGKTDDLIPDKTR